MSGSMDVADRFRKRLPDGFLSATYDIVKFSVESADERRRKGLTEGDYSFQAASYLYGHERRARVETNLHKLAALFPSVEVKSVRNRRGSYHSLIILSETKVLMTASSIPKARQMVHRANFRRLYSQIAVGNTQPQVGFDLRDDGFRIVQPDLKGIEEGLMYAVILYSPSLATPYGIGSVDIGLPRRLLKGYSGYMTLRSESTATFTPAVDEEPISDQTDIHLLLGEVEQVPEPEKGETL